MKEARARWRRWRSARHTLVWLAPDLQRPPRQLTASNAALLAALSLPVALVALLLWAWPARAPEAPAPDVAALQAENKRLRESLEAVNRKLDKLDPLVRRVRAYDDRLRELEASQFLPGQGPLEADEAAAMDAWLQGELPADPLPLAITDGLNVVERLDAIGDDLTDFDAHRLDLDRRLDVWESLADVLPRIWPVEEGRVGSGFGWRMHPILGYTRFHYGVDIGASEGVPILSTNSGIVTFAGWHGGHGMMVEVDHGEGVVSRYAHCSALLVEVGESVTVGQIVALVGSTGLSTAPHLHYELMFAGEHVDPLAWLPPG